MKLFDKRGVNLIDASVGARIRALREAREMSRAELAVRLGISELEFTKIEAGKARCRARQLMVLAQTLDVPFAELFKDVQEP